MLRETRACIQVENIVSVLQLSELATDHSDQEEWHVSLLSGKHTWRFMTPRALATASATITPEASLSIPLTNWWKNALVSSCFRWVTYIIYKILFLLRIFHPQDPGQILFSPPLPPPLSFPLNPVSRPPHDLPLGLRGWGYSNWARKSENNTLYLWN